MRIRATILGLALLASGLAGCEDGESPPILVLPDAIVTVNPTTMTLSVGQTQSAVATVQNDSASRGVTWSSNALGVATVVAATGQITGVGPGTATITATSNRSPVKSATVSVTVTPSTVPIVVNLTPSSFTLPVGQTQTLVATGDTAGYNWSSSASSIASVNATGQVTAVSIGTAVITAASKRDTTKKATSTVTVPTPPAVILPVIGSGVVSERYTAEIAVKGTYAYTTTWGNRAFNNVNSSGNVVKIWNVAGTTPVLVDSLKILGVGTTSDVQVSPDSSLLVVSTEGGSTIGSIVIYSLANPAAPTLISRYLTSQTQRGVHTVKMSVINGKLYGFLQIDPGSGLPAQEVIVDMSNPANVQQVFAQVMGAPFVHDVFVRDGLLFAANWNDGMTIFDIGGGGRGGTPASPVVISTIKTVTGQIHNIWWYQDPRNGNKKYVFLGEEGPPVGGIGTGTTSGDVHVVDISNIDAPKEVAIYSLGSSFGTHNFYVDEPSGILYAAYYNGGVRAIDVRGELGTCTAAQQSTIKSVTGTPLCDLRLMGREAGTALTTGGYYVWGVMMKGNRLYASDMGKGLVILDITALKR